MAHDGESIDIADMPQLRELSEEVRRTHHPKVLCIDSEEVAVLAPRQAKRRGMPRGKPIAADDSLWKLIGMADSDTATDVSANHDRYLADAKLAQDR